MKRIILLLLVLAMALFIGCSEEVTEQDTSTSSDNGDENLEDVNLNEGFDLGEIDDTEIDPLNDVEDTEVPEDF